MTHRVPRPVVFVCVAATSDPLGDFVSKVIQAASPEEASSLFLEQTKLTAKAIHGPFRPKRAQVIENTRTLKFSSEQKKALYNGWIVNALFLKEPEAHAYLIFDKRADGKTQPKPKGTIVVPLSDLRFNDE